MSYVRCSKCRGRTTLARKPTDYINLPRCKHCKRKMSADPVKITDPHYYVDKYREKRERGKMAKGGICFPGSGGCNEYSHPHRRGSGYCLYNPNMTEERLREREGGPP